MTNPYVTLKTDGKLALFVNSEEPPYEESPLNQYYYRLDGKDYRFYRLHRVGWLREDAVKYSLLDWREVKVKDHCVAAMKQFIDSLASAKEFLDTGMEYNVCKTCGAKNGRAGNLVNDECENCHKTRKTGMVCLHAWLKRSQDEVDKTIAIIGLADTE